MGDQIDDMMAKYGVTGGPAPAAKPAATDDVDGMMAKYGIGSPAAPEPSFLSRAAQPFKDIGNSLLAANDYATRAITHPIDTASAIVNNPGAAMREGMRGVNANIPFANRAVEAIGGPPASSPADTAAVPGLQSFTNVAAAPGVGKAVGGIAGRAVEAAAPAVGDFVRSIGQDAQDTQANRALADMGEKTYKRTRAGVRSDVVADAVAENPALRKATTDAERQAAVNDMREKAQSELADVYKQSPAAREKAAAELSNLKANAAQARAAATDMRKGVSAQKPVGASAIESPPSQADNYSDTGLYYSGTQKLESLRGDTSLAQEAEHSIPYLEGQKGFIHKVELSKAANIADESDIKAAADRIGYEPDNKPGSPAHLYELADSKRVQKALLDDGFDGMKYSDVGPNNEYEHDTTRIINPKAAKILSSREVSAEGDISEPRRPSNVSDPYEEAAKADAAEAAHAAEEKATALEKAAAAHERLHKPDAPSRIELSSPINNIDRRISQLRSGDVNAKAVADQLETLRDKFQAGYGDSQTVSIQKLRAEQSAFQKNGYGKAMPGDEAATARIAAAREASKAVGDAVIEHVTGHPNYSSAVAAAEADPTSITARLLKANDQIDAAHKIEASIADRAGRVQPKEGLAGKLERAADWVKHPIGNGLALIPKTAAAGVNAANDTLANLASPAIPAAANAVARGATVAPQALGQLYSLAQAGLRGSELTAMAAQMGVPPERAQAFADMVAQSDKRRSAQ
jgi:hypothetical protein